MAFLNYNGLKRYDKKTKEYIEDKIKKLNDIDVDELATKAELDTKANKSDIFSGDYNDLTNKPNIPDTTNLAAKTDLATHTNNDNIHVTSSEKSKWNAKLDNTDLKDYAKKVDVNSALNTKVDKVTGKSLVDDTEIARLARVDNYDDTDIKNTLNKKANKTELFSGNYNDLTNKPIIPNISNLASKDELKNHTDDSRIHVTSSEKNKWNNKAETSDIPDLTNYATKAYVTDEIVKAATSGTVDLSGYAKKVDVNSALDTKVDKVKGKSLISNTEIARLATINNYDDTVIKQTINTKANISDVAAHTSDTGIHITSAERTKWNNKAEMSDIPSLTNYATKTYVTDEIAKAATSGTVDLTGYAKTADVNSALDTKVDKVHGKSLVDDAEIYRLSKVSNYDDTSIKNSITNINSQLNTKANKSDLFSKSYNDLTDKPTIPSLDGYATKTYVTDEINKASLSGGTVDLSDYAKTADLNAHTSDTNIHITTAERNKWNAKLDNIDSDIDLEELSLNDTIFPLANGNTAQLIVTKNFDSPITYKSSDEAIATVSETGLITKLANGEATITVEAGPKSTTAKAVNIITKDSNVLPLLNIPYLHSRGIKGQGVKVAIFEDFIKSSEEFTIAGWYDFSTGTYSDTQPDPSDYQVVNHTNNMATLICGKTRGVAPDCEVYNLYPGATYNGGDLVKGAMKCVDFCIEHGIRVINDSIVFNGEPCLANYRDAYKKALDNNIIIVSGVGNLQVNKKIVADENLWLLTANSLNIAACEKDGSHRSDSCIGRSIMFSNYGFSGLQTWNPNAKYNATTGKTSAATGLTTGCVALLLCQDPTLTARQIYHILKDNAIQHTDYIQGEWNQYCGWGRINVPVLSNIKVKSDEECRLLDSEIEIVNTDVVIYNRTKRINLQPNAEGEYDVNVNDIIYINPIITPVEKDLYLSESIASNDNMLDFSNGYINTFQCCKPGKCEITVIFKGISLQKKCIFSISE